MLTLRQRIFAISGAVIGIILVLLLLYLFVFNKDSKISNFVSEKTKQIFNTDTTINGEITAPVTTTVTVPEIVPQEFSEEIYVRQLARIFVERFESYSNQNDNQHLTDVLPMVTTNMAGWINTQEQRYAGEFNGLTTMVIASTVESLTNNTAVVSVEVQQELETTSGRTSQQKTGRVNLEKVGTEWKIGGLYWDR